MSYQKLFGFDIFHDYYQDKICSDFYLEPTPACKKLLKDHRLIFKNEINGIQVISRFNSEGKPLIQLAEALKFTFVLKLKNINFVNFTDIALQLDNNSVYLFSNQNTKESESLELKPKVEIFPYSILSRKHNIWGVVEIYNNASFPQNSNYKIVFRAKRQYWKYYLITNKDTQANEFEIEDREQGQVQKLDFTPAEIDEQDRVAEIIANQFPNSQLYLFQSETEISDRELPRKNIQLLLKQSKTQKNEQIQTRKTDNKSSSVILIEHLPNPLNGDAIKVINLLKKV